MDGDLQHDPKYLPKMISCFEKKKLNLLIATRDFNVREGLSLLRFNMSKLLIFFVNRFFKNITTDPMSGYFIIKKKIFKKCKNNLYGTGFKILFDIIYTFKINRTSDYKIRFKTRIKHKSKMSYKVLYLLIKLFFYKFYKLNFN